MTLCSFSLRRSRGRDLSICEKPTGTALKIWKITLRQAPPGMLHHFRLQPVLWRCSPSHSNKLYTEEASLQAEAGPLMSHVCVCVCMYELVLSVRLVLFEHEDI